MTLDDILVEIKKADTIVVLTHESPDGDAVGSSLAVKHALESINKKVDVIIPKFSRLYNFMPGIDEVKAFSDYKSYDLAIAVDCAEYKRIAAREYFDNAKRTISIDHHGSNNMFADLNFVNPVSPACCEVLAGIFGYYEITINKKIGTCLMTGIITDTGGFRHQGINPETFEFTADLIRIGVDIPDIYKRTMCTKTRANFELSKRIMERMEFFKDGKIAFTYINLEDEKETGAEEGDDEGLVDVGRSIEGVKVSIFLRQKDTKDGKDAYKISLRSCSEINVSDICMKFGGGGHQRAAGALIQGSMEEVKEKIVREVEKAFK